MHRLSSMILTLVLGTQLAVFSAEFTEFPWNDDQGPRLSRDGSAFTGVRREDGVRTPYLWNIDDGLIDLEIPEGLSGVYTALNPRATSGDGSTVVGAAYTSETSVPMYWTEEHGIAVLDLPPEFNRGSIRVASAFGDVFVGAMASGYSNLVFRWNAEDGLQNLGSLDGFNRSVGGTIDVSADGQVIATDLSNYSERCSAPDSTANQAHIWTEQTGFQPLGTLLGADATRVRAISGDGKVVVGSGANGTCPTPGDKAFRWTAEDGMQDLGVVPGMRSSSASDVTGDGSIVVGWSRRSETASAAFVWDEANGMRDLRTVLQEEHGVSDVPRLHTATHISDDGKTIAGLVRVNSATNHVWMARLERPVVVTSGITGDFNGNAMLDVEDLDLLAVELQSERNVPLFDVNGDSLVSFDDRRFWVEDLAGTFFGDTNLDQEVNFADFLSLSVGFGGEAGWARGDFDGNGLSEFDDFLLLSQNFGKSAAAVQAVPEPTAARLLVIMCLTGICCRRSRS